MKSTLIWLVVIFTFSFSSFVRGSENKTVQQLTEEQLFNEVSDLTEKQTVHISPRHVLPKKKKVKKYKKRVKHNYPSSSNEDDLFLSKEIDAVFGEEGDSLKRGGKSVNSLEKKIESQTKPSEPESLEADSEPESLEPGSLQLEIQLEERGAGGSYEDYDPLPQYTGHQIYPTDNTYHHNINNIQIEIQKVGTDESVVSGKSLKRSPSSQLDKLPEYTGHLAATVETEYQPGGLWDTDNLDVIRNFRQTELGLKIPFNYILESNSVQPSQQFKEEIPDAAFIFNPNQNDASSTNQLTSSNQQPAGQLTGSNQQPAGQNRPVQNNQVQNPPVPQNRPNVATQPNTAPFTAFTAFSNTQINQFNGRPFAGVGIQSFTPAGGANFQDSNPVDSGIIAQQGTFQQTNAPLSLDLSNNQQNNQGQGVLINTPNQFIEEQRTPGIGSFTQRTPGIGSFTPPGGRRPITNGPVFSTTQQVPLTFSSSTRPPVINSPGPSNQFNPRPTPSQVNQVPPFQQAGSQTGINTRPVQEFNQGVNQFNTPSSTSRPVNQFNQINQQQLPVNLINQQQRPVNQINQQQRPINQINQQQRPVNQINQQQRPVNQFNPRPVNIQQQEQFRSIEEQQQRPDNTVNIRFSGLDTNLLANSAEVIDLFNTNDHIPSQATKQPPTRSRPTPTTRLAIPPNQSPRLVQNAAVFPGNSVQPVNTFNGQPPQVNLAGNSRPPPVIQSGGFPGNSVNPPSSTEFTSPSLDGFTAPVSPLTIPGRGANNQNPVSFQPANNDPNIGGFQFAPAGANVRRPNLPPPGFQGRRPERPRRSNIFSKLAEMIG